MSEKTMEFNMSKTPETKNIDSYEKEKIANTLADAEHLVAVIRNYQEMINFCDEKGIKIENRTSLENLRYPNGVAGPDSDLGKIAVMFELGQSEIAKNLTKDQVDKIYDEKIKPREKQQESEMPAYLREQIGVLLKSGKFAESMLENFSESIIAKHPEFLSFKEPDNCPEGILMDENNKPYTQKVCRCKDGSVKALRAYFTEDFYDGNSGISWDAEKLNEKF